MKDRKKMNVEEFSLLMHSLYREWQQDKTFFKSSDSRSITYYRSGSIEDNMIIVHGLSDELVWITLGKIRYEIKRPWIFSRQTRAKFDEAIELGNSIVRNDELDKDIEKHICTVVPSAKDIIAEKALTGTEDGN